MLELFMIFFYIYASPKFSIMHMHGLIEREVILKVSSIFFSALRLRYSEIHYHLKQP